MCMIDGAEDRAIVLHERHRYAAKEHKCDECRRAIEPGERYVVERYVCANQMETHKTCRHCQAVRKWLSAECGGFCYHGIVEDIREHADEGNYGVGVKMLALGISNGWKRKDGRLWRVPSIPKTTHQTHA